MQNLERLLTIKEVIKMTGFKQSYIYAKMAKKEFPKNIKIGNRSVRWKLSEIQEWIKQQS